MRVPTTLAVVLILLSPFRFTTAEDALPKTASGRMVDSQGKPIHDVSVSFYRAKRDQPPRRRGEAAVSHTLGHAATDIMGGFSIRFDTSVPTKGPLELWAGHRDYVTVRGSRELNDTNDLTITMKLLPRVSLARAIRDEDDTQKAVAGTVELLQFKPENTTAPNSRVVELFPYLNDIRAPLLEIANSGDWEDPIEGETESVGYRARLYLAHLGDSRDDEVLHRWWKEWQATKHAESLTQSTSWRGKTTFLSDEIKADTTEKVIEQLRSFVEMHERAHHQFECKTDDRALVIFYYSPIRSWQYGFEAMLVRRDGQWHVLFYRPTSVLHINFGF